VEVTGCASHRRAFEAREFFARRFQHLNSPEWTSLWSDTRFQKLVDRLAGKGATDITTLNVIFDTPPPKKSILVTERCGLGGLASKHIFLCRIARAYQFQ
jgi:hypothetical protein